MKNVTFEDGYYREPIEKSYEEYQEVRKEIFADRPDKYVSLMDIALMAMRKLKADGKLDDMDSLRMRHTTIRQRSSRLVVLQLVLVEQSAIHCPDVVMFIRQCA